MVSVLLNFSEKFVYNNGINPSQMVRWAEVSIWHRELYGTNALMQRAQKRRDISLGQHGKYSHESNPLHETAPAQDRKRWNAGGAKRYWLPRKFTVWLLFQRGWWWCWLLDDDDGAIGSNRNEADGAAGAAAAAVLENPDDAAADDDDEKSGMGCVGGGWLTLHAQVGTPPVATSGLLLWSLAASCINEE